MTCLKSQSKSVQLRGQLRFDPESPEGGLTTLHELSGESLGVQIRISPPDGQSHQRAGRASDLDVAWFRNCLS